MDATLVFLTLVVIGLTTLFIKKNPQGFISIMQKVGVGFVLCFIVLMYLITVLAIGLVALLSSICFLLGTALRFVGEKSTMFSLPLLESTIQVGIDAKDRVLQRP